MNTYITNSRQW